MTDIEQLRSNVINAARAMGTGGDGAWSAVCKAVDALDAAEKPDPVELLREVHRRQVCGQVLHARIGEALAWHDKQEADA
jgi:hypothetical protein